ncbi:hypothetical protein PM10SUCC1_12410 [Propionigenium maris DSM 9537]|uniref:Positive regulator of sigma(E), RseC/MucC n=1 Tax=Propionigenium maris DSM 9537 TaxID=1123000 RepID=A0A9W6LMK3_9FUSO|nr:SoxR reducing system RseC family protein [Propionigenium maris]GLI55727.1 hypothetical protein PM10SUCC1_12410 [Propionigenium maris DSM 9537]
MINKGIVREVKGDIIKVHLYKESACAHCSGCGNKEKMGSTFEFKCSEKVEVGNVITFEIEDKSLLNIAALVYLLPILLMIGGYFLGEFLGFTEGKRVLTSFMGLILSFAFIYTFDKVKGSKIIDQKIKLVGIEEAPSEDGSCSIDK